ncbi:MAG: HemK family protein methyltransferase [Candidatus Paceibacterota bacterium]|jgi:release factor glutamine methyltransferase
MELPEDYKRGFKEFLGIKVDLSFHPLIPREETEYWVKEAIKEIEEGSQCLDLFAGSGCIGLAVLKNINNLFCDFGDIEEGFLKGIEKSAEENKIDEKRFNLIKTDVFSNINKKYDYILSNPPYVAEKRIDEVGEDVKEFEPSVALYGGEDGMEYIEKFLTEATEYLREKGVVYMEFDPEQKDTIEEIVVNRYSKSEFFKDEFDKYRFLRLEK